jgi:hypothetical protein
MVDLNRSSGSTKSKIISSHNPTEAGLSISKALEELTTCKSGAPTQDGTKSSHMKDNTSSTSKARKHLMFTQTKMKKEERLLSGEDIMVQTKDG